MVSESESMMQSEPAVEGPEPLEPAGAGSPPKKGDKKKLWIMIVAIIVVAALIGSAAFVLVSGKKLKVTMSPDEIADMPAGSTQALSVEVKWGSSVVDSADGVMYSWSVSPSTLGEFDYEARASVTFEAGDSGGEGTITCEVTYEGKTASVEADVVVEPPFLDTVNIVPSTKILLPDAEWNFTASALNSVGQVVSEASFAWSASGADAEDYTLSSTTGATVTFSCSVEANVTLTAVATSGGESATGTSLVTVTYDISERTVDTLWYDMFGHPLGPWYADRLFNYGDEWAITDEFPYMYIWAGEPMGNTWVYTNARMNVTALNLNTSELSMNENPEYIPYLSGDDGARGGNAELNWYMDYSTYEECEEKLGTQALSYYDGWYVELDGTITLDEQAAKAVLGITDTQFDAFDAWWTTDGARIKGEWQDWLVEEAGNDRLAIYNAYEYWLDIVYLTLDAVKEGDKIVLTLDTISWGMEALMFRWMRESFLPTEWYMEDMNLDVIIRPESGDVHLDTAVGYAMYAYEATDVAGASCWAWEALVQDYVESSFKYPISMFDPYADFTYYNAAPGSDWYGEDMDWDYTPIAWNLSAGETLTLEWPDEEIVFFTHDEDSAVDPLESDTLDILVNKVRVYEALPTCTYAEPMPSDNAELISIDTDSRTVTYTGPFDMWTWSNTQEEHDWLMEEWERLGLLPYGAPYVEFRADVDEPLPELLLEDVPESVEMGEEFSFNVTVTDAVTGDPITDYTGTVTFSSSDLAAVLPADTEFEAGDNGRREFTATFNTVDPVSHQATHYLTAVDTVDSSLSDTVSDILVVESPVISSFDVAFADETTIALEPTDVTVTALNQWDEVFTDYEGTVTFTSSDEEAELPSDTTYDTEDDGVITFSVTYGTVGTQTFNATDLDDADVTGEDSIVVWGARVADHYVVTGLAEDVGTNSTITVNVTIEDQYDDLFMAYDGTMEVTSNRSADFTAPPDATFTPGLPWVEVDLEFTDEDSYYVNFTDTAHPEINASLEVSAWDAIPVIDHFEVSGITDMWEDNVSDVTVTAYNQYDSVFEGYAGTIVFTTNALTGATLPTTGLTFTPVTDKGVKTYEDGVTFADPGVFNVTVSDASDLTINGTQEDIDIEDLEASYLVIEGPLVTTLIENETFAITVTVYHQYDLPFEEYDGTVGFSTSLSSIYDELPGDSPFLPGDAGEKEFTGLSLSKVGTHTLTVEDIVDGSLTDDLEIVIVSAVTTWIQYKVYDIFEEPMAEWWELEYRWDNYGTERYITTDPGEFTYLYWDAIPDDLYTLDKTVIYAPYRWNITGETLPFDDGGSPMYASVHHPEFFPIIGTGGPNPGAEVTMKVYFDYLDEDWWTNYWIPAWGDNDDWDDISGNYGDQDGYIIGTHYDVSLNRLAAEEWLGLPTDESDVDTWWDDNGAGVESEWYDFINSEANTRLDVQPGYDDKYWLLGDILTLEEVGPDELRLQVAHMSWGYEVLMIRWLDETGISEHEPWFEDFEMVVDYGETGIDSLELDGVCQWAMHCNKQNASAVGDNAPCAWVWEPLKIDYVLGKGTAESDYELYEPLTYQSWLCGDMYYGQEGPYEAVPSEFSLPDYGTMVFELPERTDILGYYAEELTLWSSKDAYLYGDLENFTDLQYWGEMEFGYLGQVESADYEIDGNVLTINGPFEFSDARDDGTGALYHGSPWIEFNVVEPTKSVIAGDVVSITPTSEEIAPGASASSAASEMVSLISVICSVMVVISILALCIVRRREFS